MGAADTNVLVRLIVRDDHRQTIAAEAFIEKGAWVSTLALAETIWVLDTIYQRSAQDLATAIEMLLNNQNVSLQDREAVETALELFRSRPALGFSGCLILQLARKAGHPPLGTFDRDLGKIEGARKL